MYIEISSLLFALSTALDYVEKEVAGVATKHCRRVACLSVELCRKMGMQEADVLDMSICAVMHDSALTESALENTKKLRGEEYNLLRHCDIGEVNIRNFPFFQGDVKNVVLWHHENWDGSGYLGLAGSEISDRAAVLRIADNMDRGFHMEKSSEKARNEIFAHLQAQRGKLYAPHVVEAFLDCIDSDFLISLQDEHIDQTVKKLLPPKVQEVSTKELLALGCVFSNIIDSKSIFTSNHSKGLVRLAEIMGNYYDFDADHTNTLMVAAHLHDLGKLTIPREILEKKGPLNTEEFAIMKGHAQGTYDILSAVQGMETICEWAANHHEKLDGSGYPFHMDKMELSFEARLMACMDIYQAVTEDRPYRTGMSHDKAMQILEKLAEEGKLEASIVEDIAVVMQSPTAKNWPMKACKNHFRVSI